MHTNTRWIGAIGLVAAALLGSSGVGCGEADAPTGGTLVDGPRLNVAVAPLTLEGVANAVWTIEVVSEGGDTVWKRTIDANGFGDGRSAVSYVGTCDATDVDADGFATNEVRLTLDALWADEAGAEPIGFVSPGVMTRPVVCVENADAQVSFSVTVARGALQGFLDLSVDFEDIYCSAKVDCTQRFLHNPATGEREETVVVAFACTAGPGEKTWLYMNPIRVRCYDANGDVTQTATIDPSLGPGNIGPRLPLVYQAAIYRGDEVLEGSGLDKCYWNAAIGLEVEAIGERCVLEATGTAAAAPLVDGLTPAGTVYPFVRFEVQLTDATGALACAANPLDGDASSVSTAYTDQEGAFFTYGLECDEPDQPFSTGYRCAGSVGGEDVTFLPTDLGLVVAIGGAQSQAYQLPETLNGQPWPGQPRVGECCVDPCCQD